MNWRSVAAIAFLAISAIAAEGPQVRDSVVAVVNKEVITRRQVMDRAERALAVIDADKDLTPAAREKAVDEVLDATVRGMVQEKLLIAEGQRLMHSQDQFRKRVEDMVEARLEDERQKKGGEVAFRESITSRGFTYNEFVDRTRDLVLMDFVRYNFVSRNVSVSPEEMFQFYRNHERDFQQDAEVRYRLIFIANRDSGGREKAWDKARYCISLLQRGYDFGDLARRDSNDLASREKGGLYDFRSREACAPEIARALFALTTGRFTETPVEMADGFYILKVEEFRGGRTRLFEEVQPQIEQFLLARKRQERMAQLIERLEKENYVEYVR